MKELKDFIHLYLGCECVIGSDLSTRETVQAVSKDSVCVGINKYGVEGWYKTKSIKPILRPLSDMTKEDFIDIFKQVSLIGLSDCQFIFGKEEDEVWCNAEKEGKVIDSISYDYNLFKMMDNDGRFHPLNPQSEAIKILLIKHLDIFGLIEAGLAIDKTTLK